MIVPVVLGFFFLICISVVLFNCWKVASDRLMHRTLKRREQRWRIWFWQEGQHYPSLTPQQQDELVHAAARKLRGVRRLMAFQTAMDEAAAAGGQIYAACGQLPARIVREALPRCANGSDTVRAYYSYLAAHFRVMHFAPSEALTAFLLDQIRAGKGLYNLENALRAVYGSGDAALVLEALRLLDGADGVAMHEKLLVDGLLTVENREELIGLIWRNFADFGTQMQELLLDYIRFASGAWGEEMLELLQRTRLLEPRIACVRYFGRYPDERVRPLLYALCREGGDAQWELAAACMTALSSYPGGETVEVLKQGLRSRNWYIRYNAAAALQALRVDTEAVHDILTGDDRFAREMLQYRLGLDGDEAEEMREGVAV